MQAILTEFPDSGSEVTTYGAIEIRLLLLLLLLLKLHRGMTRYITE